MLKTVAYFHTPNVGFTEKSFITVNVRLVASEYGETIANGTSRKVLNPGDTFAIMNETEFLESPLGKEMFQEAMNDLEKNVSDRAGLLSEYQASLKPVEV